MDEKLLYSTQEVIKILGMSKTTILKAIKDGELKCIKKAREFIFPQLLVFVFILNIGELFNIISPIYKIISLLIIP